MTTTPDPKTVTAIAKAAMDYALRQCRDSAVEAALLASTSAPVLGREFDDLARATIAEYDRLGAVRTWPDEQPAAEQDGDEAAGRVAAFLDHMFTPDAVGDAIRGYASGGVTYLLTEADLRAVLDQRTRLAARVAELAAELHELLITDGSVDLYGDTADGGADRG